MNAGQYEAELAVSRLINNYMYSHTAEPGSVMEKCFWPFFIKIPQSIPFPVLDQRLETPDCLQLCKHLEHFLLLNFISTSQTFCKTSTKSY